MIFVIDDDQLMSECITRYLAPRQTAVFSNAIEAMAAINEQTPELIFLDIMLDGPNGFTLLHELASYQDTAKIPIVIVSSLDFSDHELSIYGVVKVLNKDHMTPADIKNSLEFIQNAK